MERLTKVMDKYLSEAKKKVLTLTVSKQWFDMIVSGEKNEEYRVIKDFWMSRLLLIKDEEFKDFDKYDKLQDMHLQFHVLFCDHIQTQRNHSFYGMYLQLKIQ
jgi:hypothetical protein